MNKIKFKIIVLLTTTIIGLNSCTDDLDTVPSTELPPDLVLTDLSAAKQLVNGIYNQMQDENYYGSLLYYMPSVMGEYAQTSAPSKRTENYYKYIIEPETAPVNFFTVAYNGIGTANIILANIDNVVAETDTDKTLRDQIKGEAYALRGLIHFDLVKVFGKQYVLDNGASLGVPLITTVQSISDRPVRNTVSEVYTQVISDLTEAISLLPEDGDNGRVDGWATKALLSRVYLYQGEYALALSTAKEVIDNSGATLVPNAQYVDMWKQDFNSESLFSIVNTDDDNSSRESIGYLLAPGGYEAITVTDEFISLLQEDPDDVRNGLLSAGTYSDYGYLLKYPGKEGSGTGDGIVNNTSVIRLSEVYLIAAEAAFKEGDTAQALNYVNAIVERANPAATLSSVTLDRILEEKSKELVLEGHRIYDAIRNKKNIIREGGRHLVGVLTPVNYDNYRTIMPIPQDEINKNPNLEQNEGY